jgi:hypothetical protein
MKAAALAIVAVCAAAPVQAQQSASAPGSQSGGQDYCAFAPFFSTASPECIPVALIEMAAVKTQALREATFRFVQAMYLMTPPAGSTLPPGDRAEIVTEAHGTAAVILIDGALSCARLALPAPMLKMILRVDNGEYERARQPS